MGLDAYFFLIKPPPSWENWSRHNSTLSSRVWMVKTEQRVKRGNKWSSGSSWRAFMRNREAGRAKPGRIAQWKRKRDEVRGWSTGVMCWGNEGWRWTGEAEEYRERQRGIVLWQLPDHKRGSWCLNQMVKRCVCARARVKKEIRKGDD